MTKLTWADVVAHARRVAIVQATAHQAALRACNPETHIFDATVYDYNRAGVVAFKTDEIDIAMWKALADRRAKVTVTVEIEDAGE